MSDPDLKRLDRRIKVFGAVISLAVVAIGVWQYLDGIGHSATSYYRGKQIDHYIEATDTVAAIAVLDDGAERQRAVERFLVLYHGSLVLFEDSGVEAAMVRFKGCLDAPSCDDLDALSLQLARAARAHLGASYRLKLDDITRN